MCVEATGWQCVLASGHCGVRPEGACRVSLEAPRPLPSGPGHTSRGAGSPQEVPRTPRTCWDVPRACPAPSAHGAQSRRRLALPAAGGWAHSFVVVRSSRPFPRDLQAQSWRGCTTTWDPRALLRSPDVRRLFTHA